MTTAKIDSGMTGMTVDVGELQNDVDDLRARAVGIAERIAATRTKYTPLNTAVTGLQAGTANDVHKDRFSMYLAQFTSMETVVDGVVSAIPDPTA